MAQCNAEGRRDITKKEIQKVIRNTSALEQKWLIRIMLKVFSSFCKTMKKYFSVRAELSRILRKGLQLYSLVHIKGSTKEACQWIFSALSSGSHYMVSLCTSV